MGLHIKELKIEGFERVLEIRDPARHFHGFISIHSTVMGPGCGGTRILTYDSREEALEDVLRLSKGMTYKAVLSNSHTGGSKSVLMIDPKVGKTKEFLEAFAEAVDYLNGSHICAEDMNCTEEDLLVIQKITPHCTGLPGDGTGDPARFTAYGVFKGIQATAYQLFGSSCLKGKKIALQGIGGVGGKLLDHLFWAGAELIIADLDADKLQKAERDYAATVVDPSEILEVECDILAPNARGGILNKESIAKLKCKAIAGAANNQLLTDEDGELLHQKGILYAPDYLINAGGLLSCASILDPEGPNPQRVLFKVDQIYNRLIEIFKLAKKDGISPSLAADQLVHTLIEEELSEKNAMV